MNDDSNIMTETPEEKAFFDSKGAETVTVTPEVKTEPELPLEQKPEAAEPAAPEEPKSPTHVPLATLLEERREFKGKIDKLLTRFEKLQELVQPKAPETPPADPEVDPIRALKETQDRLRQFETEREQIGEVQAIASFGKQHADAFRAQKPDFDEAYNHLRVARANQLMNEGKVETPQQLNETILNEEKEIIRMCAKMGVSPAAFMYNLAAAVGYAPKTAEAAPAAPQAAPAQPQPTPEEKIKMASEAQKRAANPVSKAGSGGNGQIDLKALAMLDDDEFDKATSGSNWKKMWN